MKKSESLMEIKKELKTKYKLRENSNVIQRINGLIDRLQEDEFFEETKRPLSLILPE